MRLYLVTDRALLLGKDLLWTVREAAAGGVTMVQLREKECATREFVELARAVKGVLEPFRVPLLVNDRVDVALAAGADGVHVGQSDMAVADVRRLMPPGAIVGLSAESEAQLIEAEGLPIDYIALSPVFSTPTKTDTVIEWGLEGISRAKGLTRHPIVAIGGIHLGNAAAVRAVGADSVCVVSAICSATDPRAAARSFLEVL
ncbi:MAG: thiamine phosphate synthase [Rikenellaceae bacterium]|jgi:thiamine-phosphate pyrophosphorylase|nr:thiamine phosphate synthase [Rikenellaceae bacterium]